MDRGRARPYVVEHLTGCLIGVRVDALRSPAELLDASRRVRTVMEGAPALVVGCADYRALQSVSPDVADGLAAVLRASNARVRRSAFLLPMNAPALRLQMERVLREAGHPERRICVDVAEVKAWLSSHLDATERSRLDAFLARRSR